MPMPATFDGHPRGYPEVVLRYACKVCPWSGAGEAILLFRAAADREYSEYDIRFLWENQSTGGAEAGGDMREAPLLEGGAEEAG
jgi:hypothetical protein